DHFNANADWGDILEPHGWKWVGTGGDRSDLWRRPGKRDGTSATTNYAGSDLLYVFSSNAPPFDEGRGYSKFHAFALLEHCGDFRAAAKALAAQGFGSPGRKRPRAATPFDRYAG